MDCYLKQLCMCGCSARAYICGTKIYTNFVCIVGNLFITRYCCYFLAELLKTALFLLSVKSHDFAQYFMIFEIFQCSSSLTQQSHDLKWDFERFAGGVINPNLCVIIRTTVQHEMRIAVLQFGTKPSDFLVDKLIQKSFHRKSVNERTFSRRWHLIEIVFLEM